MRVLVTGGCGFVGRHFVDAFIRRGDRVDVVDNLSSGLKPEDWMPGLNSPNHCYFSDVRRIDIATPTTRYDIIIHCAAVVGGRLKIEGDPLAVATDLSIDAEFFNWVVRLDPKPKRVVYFSSSAVYPIELQTRTMNCALLEGLVNFNTSRIGMPDASYGWSKLSGEFLAQIAAKKYGLNVHIFRPFSGYGPDQDLTYPFPALVKRIIDGENPVTIWGSGDQQRDWINISDVVDIVLGTADDMAPGETLNLGSGVGVSFRDLVARMAAALGKVVDVAPDTTKPQGAFCRVADTHKLSRFCDLRRQVSLEEGVKQVADHLSLTR